MAEALRERKVWRRWGPDNVGAGKRLPDKGERKVLSRSCFWASGERDMNWFQVSAAGKTSLGKSKVSRRVWPTWPSEKRDWVAAESFMFGMGSVEAKKRRNRAKVEDTGELRPMIKISSSLPWRAEADEDQEKQNTAKSTLFGLQQVLEDKEKEEWLQKQPRSLSRVLLRLSAGDQAGSSCGVARSRGAEQVCQSVL
jgi:hypothetical protein